MDFLNDHVGVWSNNNNYETTQYVEQFTKPCSTILLYSSP